METVGERTPLENMEALRERLVRRKEAAPEVWTEREQRALEAVERACQEGRAAQQRPGEVYETLVEIRGDPPEEKKGNPPFLLLPNATPQPS